MYRMLLCGVIALSALVPCHAADILVNGSFDPHLTGWTRDFGSCGSDNGGRSGGGGSDWRALCCVESAGISQEALLGPGQYSLNFAGYYLLPYAKSSVTLTNSYINFSIFADGNEVASHKFTASGNPSYPTWTPWTLAGVSWTGWVSQSVSVKIAMQNLYITTPGGREGYGVCVDDVSLDANPVPEPSGIAAMLSAFGLMAASRGRKPSFGRKAS